MSVHKRPAGPKPVPLLFWEVGLLSAIAGILTCTWPIAAPLAWLLMLLAEARARGIRLAVLCLCFAGGLATGWMTLPAVPPGLPPWAEGQTEVEGLVVETRALPENRLRIVLDAVRPAPAADVEPAPKKETLPALLTLTWLNAPLTVLDGQRLRASLKIRPVRGFLNEHGSDFAAYWHRQGIGYTSWLSGTRTPVVLEGEGNLGARLRSAWREKMERALTGLPPQVQSGAALIPALLFADQRHLSMEDLERVTKAGLRHSLALSGQHLAVVGLLALLPVWLLERLFPSLLLLTGRRVLTGCVSLPLAALCLWLGDAPPSLVRAALMMAIWLVVAWRGTVLTLQDVLFVALACMMFADPGCLHHIGVQLSFLAVAGIAAGHALWRHYAAPLFAVPGGKPPLIRRFATNILWALCLSVSAQLATLPIVLHTFGRITPGLVYNLLWLPVLGLFVLPLAWLGMVLLVVGLENAAHLCLQLASLPGTVLLQGFDLLEQHDWLVSSWSLRPHWTAMLGFGFLLAGAVALFGKASGRAANRLLIAGALLAVIGPGLRLADALTTRHSIYVADVGQGQAVLLEWPGGRGLVDGGGFASSRLDSGRDVLAPMLAANQALQLDFVAASHMDRDHIGGLFFMLEHFSVPTYLAGATDSTDAQGAVKNDARRLDALLAKQNIPAVHPVSGDHIPLDDGTWLEVLWPPQGRLLRGNDSMVLRLVRKGEGLALLTGDIEPKAQREMLRLHAGRDIRARVLILPHHGSRRNLEPDLYTAVKPDYAIASCGERNPWNFPAPEVAHALEVQGIPLYTTATLGGIRVFFDRERTQIRPVRHSGLNFAPLLRIFNRQ